MALLISGPPSDNFHLQPWINLDLRSGILQEMAHVQEY